MQSTFSPTFSRSAAEQQQANVNAGKGWLVQEVEFEAEDSDFICEGDTMPLQPDRSSELAVETWNLKKTIFDLSSQTSKLKSELRTQKNVTKNLQKINAAVQQENKDRAKENIQLKAAVAALERRVEEMTQQNATMTTNVTRNKRVANQLQGKINELSTSHTQQLKDRDAIIQECKDRILLLEEELKSEKEKSEQKLNELTEEKDRFQSVVHTSTLKIDELQRENNHLTNDVAVAREQCADAARFLNKELEKAFESMHSKLEKVIAKKDEYRMKLLENEFERDQILAFMLSEGLQMPHFIPLNVNQARERIRIENLGLD